MFANLAVPLWIALFLGQVTLKLTVAPVLWQRRMRRALVIGTLTAMGKMIGGGFPVGALAGRAQMMDVMDPWRAKVQFPLSGTYSANPVTMVVGRTAMELFDRPAGFPRASSARARCFTST